ncbi:MAG TPA: EAL domain-containing protein [Acidimicrobiales bacterium]|nr:EAL domain-containing protein [Acidimicrobiales bacterium]
MELPRSVVPDAIFDRSEMASAYQPIVDLSDGCVVAAEALARWPGLEVSPEAAFAEARRRGRVAELDLLCQRAAVEGLRDSRPPEGFRVFVNVEPGGSVETLTERTTGPRLIAEITERALLEQPAELLRSVAEMRARGCGIALDDVGAVPDSLALMPFLAPDVIKLDMSLVQGWPDADQARILTAVAAYAERSGATVLAEGIETESDLRQALALGATLGQGWYFGRPGPLGASLPPRHPIALLEATTETSDSPFELLDPRRVRTGAKGTLLAISRHIEQQGMTLETPPLVLAAFQDAGRFTAGAARRYAALAARCPLVVALGAGMSPAPAPGVRGGGLGPRDRLRGEWTVVVVGPHYAGALIAKDLGDSGPDLERRYLFALTHDHATVVGAARILLGRILPLPARRPDATS